MLLNVTSYMLVRGVILYGHMGFVLEFPQEIIFYKPKWQSRNVHQTQFLN
jgi:hypothetical protein